MKLIIVESPTKAKTITKFIDSNYKLESSFGHIRDLPKSKMGIDIENDYQPQYIIPTKAKKNVSKLKKLAEQADEIILASDEDREGEAIAWHLVKALKIPEKETKRIVFHEITKPAIEEALKNPKGIDHKMVDAQQARRILDRLVGYELSPFLWKKVVKGLSAGRVQSVAVRLVVEREKERQAFKEEEYWTIEADFRSKKDESMPLLSKLNKIDDRTISKITIKTEKEAKEITNNLKDKEYQIKDISTKENLKNPPRPFTTSTLQQTANRWLGFSSKQTMMIAQQLYEGIDIKGEGHSGLITYMRTDSLNLSKTFIEEARDYINKKFSDKYLPNKANVYKTKSKGAQEAHEAIRPTSALRSPDQLENSLTPQQYKLYKLIWQRSVASQMNPAKTLSTTCDITALDTPYEFRSTGQITTFKGYLEIYPEKSQQIEFPELEKEEELKLEKLEDKQHFTQPPARYSDAGLVKEMEKYGIGRPSTYAPTISTIITRNYVNRDDSKRLFPTDIAFVVIDLLKNHFPQIVDFKFTANLEKDLDEISSGNKEWVPVVDKFYKDFHQNLEKKYNEINKKDIMPEEESKEICDKCGSKMIIKTGRYGKFLACGNFPDCKNAKPLGKGGVAKVDKELEKLKEQFKGEKCEKCGSEMTVKKGKYGYFKGCSNYPKCKNIQNIKQPGDNTEDITCPKCEKGKIVKRFGKRGPFYACDNYPDCKNIYSQKPVNKKCPECDNLLLDKADNLECSNKSCDYSEAKK
ncbi:type I DNA topoisomerase [Patescibacteria group bacterium]|nr:type I DNA topoisomerase [Patescibacteria group bacterium]